jgi:outer membrane protein insertion porin family
MTAFMHNIRAFGLAILSFTVLALAAPIVVGQTPQQIVESVDIQGNRRLRDEDLLYYIKTRPGDVYDPAALERDLKELLSLNFFDKTATRVLTEAGARGGVNVIFEVKELPIIRDLEFKGAKAVQESDILKAFREQRAGVSKESVYDPVKARGAIRILRELLASKGYPNAKIDVTEEEVSATSIAVTFNIDQGPRSRIIDIQFEGLEHFKNSELKNAMQYVRETGLISRVKGQDILDMEKLQADLQRNVRSYMFSKGYFQARIGEPQVVGLGIKRTDFLPLVTIPLPLISTMDETLKIVIPVTEGKVYRVGELKVEGNSIFSEQQILSFVGLKKGEIADGKRLQDAVYEDLKKAYGNQGFVQYDAEFIPDFKDNPSNPNEGIVDVTISITEGKQFTLRRLEFTGNTFTRDRVMRREFLLNEGDIYNQRYLDISVVRLNQLQYFDPIDKDKDVETRVDDEAGDVDLIVKVKEKGRQQISFNGGVGGLGGSFFGFEYSTNNLMGKGEILSVNAGWGNRQLSLQLSYQEPYFRNRPISVGFSLFATKYKFFGEGTFLSQNTDLINQLLFDPTAQLTTNSENLFTQSTYGGTIFATAPLSELFFKKRKFTQFSRVGLTYQLSATSIQDPKVNQTNDPTQIIPVLYTQPNILTSQITASFVYDTRQPAKNGIDTLRGSQLAISLGFAGLGGDVRTYQPNVSYEHFLPVRRKKSQDPEVFAFRVQAGTIGSWSIIDKIKNANSIAFVGGIPIYQRYFLGSENDIRGYDSRAIGPIAPFDTFVTTRNVVVADNAAGTAVPTNLSQSVINELKALGTLTGTGGTNPALLSSNFRFIGGDTELLGNFEYRIPIFGPATMAVFADVGSVFNLHKTGTQEINSAFLADDTFLGAGTLTQLVLRNNPAINAGVPSLLFFNDRLLGANDIRTMCDQSRIPGCPFLVLPDGVLPLQIRGEAQQNSLLRVDDARFSKIGDFRSSVGVELRVQVPIVNVPFRLIYYYNPNAKLGFTDELPGIFLPGKRSGVKFTVGRTF